MQCNAGWHAKSKQITRSGYVQLCGCGTIPYDVRTCVWLYATCQKCRKKRTVRPIKLRKLYESVWIFSLCAWPEIIWQKYQYANEKWDIVRGWWRRSGDEQPANRLSDCEISLIKRIYCAFIMLFLCAILFNSLSLCVRFFVVLWVVFYPFSNLFA